MARYRAIWQLTLVKIRELVREPEAVFWIFFFPILLAAALGIAFRSRGGEMLAVGVQDGPGAVALAEALATRPELRVEIVDSADAHAGLRRGRLALVVLGGEQPTFWYDPQRPESQVARLAADDALQAARGRRDVVQVGDRKITERGSRYIDFLVPGLLGMNLMGTGMWGIGFSVVTQRQRRILKRLAATPMRRSDFLLGQVGGRLAFLVVEVGVLLAFARVAFDVPIRGSLLNVVVLSILGAMTFAGLGLLVASRTRTVEGISGLINVVMVPMWIGSGIFFSTSRFPDVAQPFIQALPLTALNDALRGVMLDGTSLIALWGEVGITLLWGVASFGMALVLFRWR